MFNYILRALFFLCITFASIQGNATDIKTLDIAAFGALPVMHEGRTKPIDSFARSMLQTYSGSDDGALVWLIETLFNPAHAENLNVIKVINPDLLNLLEIDLRKKHLYSYNEVSTALTKNGHVLSSIVKTPESDWTPAQRDFVLLQQKMVSLGDLLSSMSLYLPLAVQLSNDNPKSLRPYANKNLTYLDTIKFQETLQNEMKSIVRKHGENIQNYSKAQQQITLLSFTVANLRLAGKRSQIFQVIPLQNDGQWSAPWQIIFGAGTPKTKSLFDAWRDLATAYHNNDSDQWDAQVSLIQDKTFHLGQSSLRSNAIQVEYIYNRVAPLNLSAWLYALTLILAVSGFVWQHISFIPSFVTFICATTIHTVGIASRIFILERPPVSTLYESIVFVALVLAFYGLILFWKNKDYLWTFMGAGGGLLLLLFSYTHDQDGDNLMMLSAVLNTNFWLATHVICITLGYAFCLITSVLAHVALLKPQQGLLGHMNVAAIVSLLLATLGTVLGGIWADQSWGRFWGWDPKENGALLIVLWLIWILHGKISGHMNAMFVKIGLAYLSVIVALSWFGVNLLNVGLHAYGFTDAAAWGLFAFIVLETMCILGIVLYQRRNRDVL
jgi:ABC-type transport system involved in cytochrome c biogenesis permease subunit